MVRAKDSFKYRFVDYDDDSCCFWWLIFDLMSDVLNIDDDTNEGLILGITESVDDKSEDNFDNGQNDDDEE